MSKDIVERCPFRDGSASKKLYLALAKSEKPMSTAEVARAARILPEKAVTLVAAYRNMYHRAPLQRVGVKLELNKDGYFLKTCKADPDCKRPPRGMKSKQTAAKPAKKTVKASPKPKPKSKAASKPKKVKLATPSSSAAPAPIPDTSDAPVAGSPEVPAQ